MFHNIRVCFEPCFIQNFYPKISDKVGADTLNRCFMKSISTYKYIILLVFTAIFSCTDTGEDIEPINIENFLKKNDGTEWLLSNDDLKVYIRLNDDLEQLIEQWRYNLELNCYEYNPNIFSPGNLKIVENSSNELTIEGDAVLSDYEHMTLTREGNTLKVLITITEWQEEAVYFTQATLQLEDLERCTDQEGNKTDWLDLFLNR